MASTTITDYSVLSALTQEYVAPVFYKKLSLLNTGVAVTAEDLDFNLNQGNAWNVRGYKAVYSEWATLTAATDMTLNSLSTRLQTGVIARRGDAFGVETAARIAGGDITDAAAQNMAEIIGNHAGYNVERMFFSKLIPALFDETDGCLKDSNLVIADAALTMADIEDGLAKAGENMGMYEYIYMHPAVYSEFRKTVLISEDYLTRKEFNELGVMWAGRIGGLNIILNNRLNKVGDVYDTLLFRPGAVMIGYQKDMNIESYREPRLAGGTDVSQYTLYFSPHVLNTSFTGTVPTALTGASDANLALATNWSSVAADPSEIGVVAIHSTVTA